MQAALRTIFTIGLAAVLAAGCGDAALAKHKKQHVDHTRTGVGGDLSIKQDYDGTPIIIQGYRPRRTEPAQPERRANRPVHIPRGSSTYIPSPVPSPNSPNSPPAGALTQPVVQPYNPPPITTYSDRVINCIHSYPLNKGLGNNPTDQQSYIRQCAN